MCLWGKYHRKGKNMENSNTIVPVVLEADLIEQQKQARLEKARETRRRNNLEKKVITNALTQVAKQKVKMLDENGKIVIKTKAELLSEKILEDALSDEISAKDRQEAFKLIRDTMGEKPTERVEAQVGLTLEDYVKKVQGDSDY